MSLSRHPHRLSRTLRGLLLAGVAAAALTACASNRASMQSPDFSGQGRVDAQHTLEGLADRYRKNPKDKATMIYYAAALRSAGQSEQAVAVLESAVASNRKDIDLKIAFAKALASAGRFDQALNVVDSAINPASPDWNALSVKGAILDQSGQNAEARVLYQQALTIAPGEASLHANLGLSYAMTNELVEAEAQLRHAQKLESVGQLAAGVAHDFNNILTVIQGYSDCLLVRAHDNASRSALKQIGNAARRAAALTRQLLTFSRKQIIQTKVLDLNGVLQNLYNMLPRLLGEDIVLQTDYAKNLGRIEADTGMIEQVVMNLAVTENFGSAGMYGWSGLYGTRFWIDPKEQLVSIVMVQRYPGSTVDAGLLPLVYQSLTRPAMARP